MSMFEENETSMGLDDITSQQGDDYDGSRGPCDDAIGFDEGEEFLSEESVQNDCFEDVIMIDDFNDIKKIDMKNISEDDLRKYDFADLDVAHKFYIWYGRSNGFSVRKSNVVSNSKGDILQQTFVCSAQGHGRARRSTRSSKKRQSKLLMRFDCKAMFRVHINVNSGRWYVTIFDDSHNRKLLEEQHCGMLPAYRKRTESDIMQINNFREVGIRPPHIYGSFARHGVLEYLRKLRLKDNLMFYKHIADEDGRLRHLFWCDGESQMNYQVFGDVLAFDATYRKNKYMCHVVIFSGVNNHNQTIVFASAIVSDETEQTYVWLLEQLAQVMKGKAPSSVITDGDLALRNAIRKVFPNAHHRLCAWHLLRNATSNVGIPDFMTYFKRCKFIHSRINLTEFMQQFHRFLTYFRFREVEADFRFVHGEPVLQTNFHTLERWTKSVKASIHGTYIDGSCSTSTISLAVKYRLQPILSACSRTNFTRSKGANMDGLVYSGARTFRRFAPFDGIRAPLELAALLSPCQRTLVHQPKTPFSSLNQTGTPVSGTLDPNRKQRPLTKIINNTVFLFFLTVY
ncbi:MULE transposase domain [Sesbania bispinosa]|nr:MULE transposase domain [Sesbania bispinosa]